MLAILGFSTLVVFMVLVIRKWTTPFVAIAVVPVVALMLTGRGAEVGEMIASGIETVAPTAVLLLFAVLYFGVMIDARLFEPVSRFLIRVSKGDPVKICVGTAILACVVALDGDGTTSYMIICGAFLPIYKRLGLNPLILATICVMALGTVSGTTPWGGAATRAISVLNLDATDYFVHMVGPMAISCATVCCIAAVLGLNARRKMDSNQLQIARDAIHNDVRQKADPVGWRIWANAALTATLLVCLVVGVADLMVLFIGGFIIALFINYAKPHDQSAAIKKYAEDAIPVVMLVLGAGVFTGILSESGMTTAMANALVGSVPDGLGGFLPIVAAVIGIPLSFFMANDAYFFGIVPVLAESAAQYGVPPVEMARASVIGQLGHSIGPASPPLWALLGILKVNLGDVQKFAWKWVLLASFFYLVATLLTGSITIRL